MMMRVVSKKLNDDILYPYNSIDYIMINYHLSGYIYKIKDNP